MTINFKKLSVAVLTFALLATNGIQLARGPHDIVEVVSIQAEQN